MKYCLLGCYFGLLWDKHSCIASIERGGTEALVSELQTRFERIYKQSIINLLFRLASFMAVSKDLMGLESAGAALKEEAFISICDLLIVFGHCGENKGEALLKPLQYKPDQPLGTVLNIFVQDHVFIDDDEEDIDDHQKIEELHKRRNFLASYCKLVVYNVLPTKVSFLIKVLNC